MSHTNGAAAQARIEELQRHVRVLEHHLPPPDSEVSGMIMQIHAAIGRLDVDHRERNEKLLRVLNGILTQLHEVVEAQNRTTQQFTLLLAGLRLAPAPQPPSSPSPPRKSTKAKRTPSR